MLTVTGELLKINRRTGTARATGNPYDITTARILGEDDVLDVTLGPDLVNANPQRGDAIEWVIEAQPVPGALGTFRLRAVAEAALVSTGKRKSTAAA